MNQQNIGRAAWPGISLPTWLPDVAAGGLIAAWIAMLLGIPAVLPLQAASWLTFIGLLITPGFLLGDLVLRRLNLDWIERLAIAFPLGMTVLTGPGLAALLLHWTVADLSVAWAVVTTIIVGFWLGRRFWFSVRRPQVVGASVWPAQHLAMLILLAIGFLLVLPTLTLPKIDGDAYAVGSFSADALSGTSLNLVEPLFGTDLGPGVRMAFNQSLPMAYLWAYWSQIDPVTLASVAARPMIALWALMAAYMFGKAAGEDEPGKTSGRRIGLLVASIQFLIYLTSPFLRGDNVSLFFFERITADKFMVPVTMLPVVFAMAIRFLRSGERAAWWGAVLVAFAVSAIHPLIAAMLALALSAFGGFHALLNIRSRLVWQRVMWLAAVVLIVMTLPVVQLVASRGEDPLAPSYPNSVEGWPVGEKLVPALPFVYVPTMGVDGPLPDLSQLDADEADSELNPFLIWRFAVNMERRRLILFDLDFYISDPNIVLEPPYLLALLSLPLLLFGIRKRLGAQFALASTASVLIVMFNPVITPLIGNLVMPWILWRFVWLLPYALILALVVDRVLRVAIRALDQVLTRQTQGNVQQPSPWTHAVPLAFVLLVTLAVSPMIVRNLRTLHERAAYPYYFPTPPRLLDKLGQLTRTQGPAMVLADQDLSVSLPAYVAGANIVAHRVPTTSEVFPADRQVEALQRLIDQNAFFQSRYLTEEAVAILERYDVQYIVTTSGSDLDIQLRLAPEWFEWLLDDQSYSLYAVHQLPAVTDNILANTALADRQWAEAERLFRNVLDGDGNKLMALAGLAEVAHTRGQFNDALSLYARALRLADLPVLHYRLGELYVEMGRLDSAINEFDIAQQAAPQISRLHVAMGDACLAVGREGCAADQFAQAVAVRNLPDEASRQVALADLWRQRGRIANAIDVYAKAVELQPSLVNQLMLAGAYQEGERFAEAEALLRLLRTENPFSPEVLALAAEVRAAEGDYGGAAGLYRSAIAIQEWTGRDSVENRVALTQILLDGGDLEAAEAQIDRVLARRPQHALAHGLRGELLSRLDRPEEAVEALREAFRLDPTQVQLYLALSSQFRRQGGKQDEVLALLQAAIRANPEEATLALALGDQLQNQGKAQDAIDAYQQALDMFELETVSNALNPRTRDTSRAYAYLRLARVSEDLGMLEPAMNFYGAAVAAAPDASWAQVLYGDALRRRGDMAGAAAAYRRSIDVDPTFANAYVQLADLLYAQGQTVEAEALRSEALKIAIALSTEPQASKGVPGLARLAPGTVALTADGQPSAIDTFDSDGATTSTASTVPQAAQRGEQGTVEQIVADLVASGDRLLQLEDNTTVLNLLTRLAEESGQTEQVIELYYHALERGRQAGWYPVTLAQYYKGLGDLYLAQGEAESAAGAYEKAIEMDDWWPQAHLGLAEALDNAGELEHALQQYQTAVEIAPGFVEAQVALAGAYVRRNDADSAMDIYRATAQAHPGNPQATLALAEALQEQREWLSAERTYRETIEMNPGSADAYVELAVLLMEQARYEEAKPLLEQAMDVDREYVNAYIQMGILAQRTGAPAVAREWFRRSAGLRTTVQSNRVVLLDLMQRFGNSETGLTYVQEWLRQDPYDVELLLRQARLERLLGRDGDALSTLLSAAQMDLADSRLSAELGELYWAQGRPQAALAAYRQTITQDPHEAAYYLRLSELWRGQADLDQAKTVLRSGIRKATHTAPLYAALAEAHMAQGDLEAAKDVLEAGLSAHENDSALLIARGLYLERSASLSSAADDAAETWYTSVIARMPENAALHAALADHYVGRERLDEALLQYERAIELEPTNAGIRLAAAAAYASAGRTEAAELAYRHAYTLEPTLLDAYVGLANLFVQAQAWDEAEAAFQRGLEVAPADGEFLMQYAGYLLTRGEQDRALAILDRSEQISTSPDMYRARASVYRILKQDNQALADLQTALQKEPGSLDTLIALGDLYRDLGKTQDAQQKYASAAQIYPGIATGRLRLARLTN